MSISELCVPGLSESSVTSHVYSSRLSRPVSIMIPTRRRPGGESSQRHGHVPCLSESCVTSLGVPSRYPSRLSRPVSISESSVDAHCPCACQGRRLCPHPVHHSELCVYPGLSESSRVYPSRQAVPAIQSIAPPWSAICKLEPTHAVLRPCPITRASCGDRPGV